MYIWLLFTCLRCLFRCSCSCTNVRHGS